MPGSGRYDLNSYLPVFLWTLKVKNAGKSPFSELLKLLSVTSVSVGDITNTSTDTDRPTEAGPSGVDDMWPCLYCPRQFSSEKLHAEHLVKCRDTPNTDTVKLNFIIHLFHIIKTTLFQDNDGNLVPLINCEFCSREFKNKRAVKAHQRSCPQKPK